MAVPVAGEAAAATAAGIIVPETTPETDAETGEAGPPTETGSPDATTTPFAEPQAALVAAPSPGGATATPLPAGDGGELRSLPPLALRGPHGRAGEANAATQVPTKDAPDGAPRTAIGPAGDAASGRDGAPAHAALIADREDAASGSAAGAASDRGVLPPLASPTPAHAPAAEAARAVAPQVIPPTPVQMTPLVIGLKAMEGAREFSIRLQPEDLGRVDVTLSIKDDGRVGASLVADRVETLALLQRDARTLERAFDQAGLTADQGAIRFSLRQDNASGQQAGQGESGAAPAPPARAAETDPAAAPRPAIWRGRAGLSGVDILV